MSGRPPQSRVSFGSFEVDLKAGELRKHGIHIKLHEKPFALLAALLEQPGKVVARKELQARLWPQDTFVEFENGLNNTISRLREALGDTAESPRFIETIPRQGYRFLAEVSNPREASHALELPQGASSSSATHSFRRWLLVLLVTVGTALLLSVASHFVLPRPKAIQSLAVLPFRNLNAGTADDYFSDGMTDAVTTELAKLGVSKVISETSVAQFKDTKKSVPEIASTLGVDGVVEGAVLREGNQVRITVQLIRADTDRHMWAETYQRQMADILALQNDVALGVAHTIKLELSPDSLVQRTSAKPVNAEAYEAYLQGRYFMQERDESAFRAKDYFERAMKLDPGYAPAYSGLADFYILTDALPPKDALAKAKEYAQQALKLDSNLPENHISLAYIYFYEDWNWPAADQEFRRAIALAPGLSPSYRWYAIYLAAMGRVSEATKEVERAEELDPLSITAHDGAAVVASAAGQYDRCIDEGRKIMELDPNDPRGYGDIGVGHLQKRMYQEALQDAEKGLAVSHRNPFFLSLAAYAYGRLGNMEQANKLVHEMPAADEKSPESPSMLFATAFVGMGKQKEAIDALETGYKLHDADLVGLNSTPWFEPLRSDPRFQDLLHRMNFPK